MLNEKYVLFSKELDETWQGMRWILDALHYARDRQIRGGIPLVDVFQCSDSHPDGQCCVCSSDLKGKVLCNGHSKLRSITAMQIHKGDTRILSVLFSGYAEILDLFLPCEV